MLRVWLLAFLPVAAGLQYFVHASAVLVFVTGAVAVGVLADWVRRATEQTASHLGSTVGGLLNVSFGSAAELILAVFVLLDGKSDVVRAQITGSIIGTSLLGLGLAILAGGLLHDRQKFRRARAGLLSSMLILVVIALLLPAVFDLATRARGVGPGALGSRDEELSIGVSIVLLLLYAGDLVFTMVTHRSTFQGGKDDEDGDGGEKDDGGKKEEDKEKKGWSLRRSLTVLVGATLAIAVGSELVSGALEATGKELHIPLVFLGVVPLALIGTSSDLFAAVAFARQDRMGLVMSICVGSALQVALVLAPLLVLISWAIGQPMTLVFPNALDLFAIAGTAFIVNAIAGDGETTWFEGLLLLGVYVLLALAFFFTGTG